MPPKKLDTKALVLVSRVAHENAGSRLRSNCAALAVDDSTGKGVYENDANSGKRGSDSAAVDNCAPAARAADKGG